MIELNVFVAFTAGLLAFVSPCVLPLVPAYIAYLSGTIVRDGDLNKMPVNPDGSLKLVQPTGAAAVLRKLNVFFHALFFVLGFAFIFTLLGIGLSYLSSLNLLRENIEIVRWIAGIVLIIFGLHMLTIINIPFLNYERRVEVNANPALGYFGSSLVGMGFAVGWTPCVGTVLGSVFSLILNDPNPNFWSSGLLLFSFAMGLGVPFLIASLALTAVTGWLRRLTSRGLTVRLGKLTILNNLNVVAAISGAFLIFMGVAIATNSIVLLNQFFNFLPTNGLGSLRIVEVDCRS